MRGNLKVERIKETLGKKFEQITMQIGNYVKYDY